MKTNVKKLLKLAEKPSKDARRLHPFYKGKIEVVPKCRIRDFKQAIGTCLRTYK